MTLEDVVKAIEVSQSQKEQVKLFVSDDLTSESDSISESDDSQDAPIEDDYEAV